jgi:hypothetical protein
MFARATSFGEVSPKRIEFLCAAAEELETIQLGVDE